MNANSALHIFDPRQAKTFRFVRCGYDDGTAELVYAFDDGPELSERIRFPAFSPSPLGGEGRGEGDDPVQRNAFTAALRMLHLIAGISYYKASVPLRIEVETGALDDDTAGLLDTLYLHGLAEFAYRNGLDLRDRIAFPRVGKHTIPTPALPLKGRGASCRALVPIGGGKDSLVVVEALKAAGIDATATWVGASPLIAGVAARTGLPTLNIGRELSPVLFEYNRMGAWNGHIPVTAINSAILACAAVLYGFDAIVFANERSASAATLEYAGGQVNHQWSKGWTFEKLFAEWLHAHVAADLDYFSLLRPYSELAVTRAFAKSGAAYFDVFSSCNRNFRIRGPKPADRWCGQCPKCHFVFLALAPFLPKPRLLQIFGSNLLDDDAQAAGFDALIEYRDHKPFECVGEAREARAAFAVLAARPEWREDALVRRFREEIAPQLDGSQLALDSWLGPSGEHGVPERFADALEWIAS
ncbi:MAG TPA: UDP-N-acetyl-alpha-D-muramoyl-L-alanyl-L-glutamate epimerase [Rhodanobacteraceae bacterium]|nr:UDP-N-acetyl-alpha-D-muramoyl-L-alanyl-L-glutamate epimerase [Rhodanobacteraceae bacterium]